MATQGDDSIVGTARRDRIDGLGGDDEISGLGGRDRLKGGDGDDVLLGGPGDDELDGGANADFLRGGTGADSLEGNTGRDDLSGGAGQDRMAGGAGDDFFDLKFSPDNPLGRDVVLDFQRGLDDGDKFGITSGNGIIAFEELDSNDDGDLNDLDRGMSIELITVQGEQKLSLVIDLRAGGFVTGSTTAHTVAFFDVPSLHEFDYAF